MVLLTLCYSARVPLTPEIKEVLEVAYVSRIMSKNFRKEGQPEKERIARITGMEFDKVHVVATTFIRNQCIFFWTSCKL